MKKITAFAAMLLLTVVSFAQDGKSIYNKYSNEKGVSCVFISPAMFKMIGQIPDLEISDEDIDLAPIIQSMSGMYIISSDNTAIGNQLEKDVKKTLDNSKFEKMMEAKDDGETVHIYIRKEGELITSFVLLATESDECTFISIDGKISGNDLSELIKKMK